MTSGSIPLFFLADVQLLYGNGNGDLAVVPTFTLDRVVDGDPVTGEVRFVRGGQEVEVLISMHPTFPSPTERSRPDRPN